MNTPDEFPCLDPRGCSMRCKVLFEHWREDGICSVFQCQLDEGHTCVEHEYCMKDNASDAILRWGER